MKAYNTVALDAIQTRWGRRRQLHARVRRRV